MNNTKNKPKRVVIVIPEKKVEHVTVWKPVKRRSRYATKPDTPKKQKTEKEYVAPELVTTDDLAYGAVYKMIKNGTYPTSFSGVLEDVCGFKHGRDMERQYLFDDYSHKRHKNSRFKM